MNTVDSDAMYKALHQGKPIELTETGLFSDGTSVRLVGKEPFKLCQKYVDDFVLVTNDEICAAGGHDQLIMTYDAKNNFKPLKKLK